MRYVIHYDVAGVVLVAAVMVQFFMKKTISTRLTRRFSVLIFLAFISNVLDLLSIYCIENPWKVPLWLNYGVSMAYLATFNATAAVYFMYLIALTKDRTHITRLNQVTMWLPILVDLVLIATTPFTKFVIYYDEERTYRHGVGMMILYLVALYYVGLAMVHAIRYRKILNRAQRLSVYFYTILSLLAIVLQMKFDGLLLAQFAVAVSMIMIYLSLENPQDYTDRELGIYNRRAFLEVLSQNIEREHHYEVLGISIVGMRHINEMLGVTNGNMLLKQISEFLVDTARNRKVFYLSGNVFAVISENNQAGLDDMTKKIRAYFGQPMQLNGVEFSITVCMSILSYENKAKNLADAVDMLEFSLGEAKKADNDTVVYANAEMLQKVRREQQILQLMKQSIWKGGFEVFYQPIYSVEKKCFTSAEALIRMRATDQGYIGPEEFIPIAEKNGLIIKIGEMVFREVCRFMTGHRLWEKGIECIDVNLSPVQCMQKNLHETLLAIMDEYQLPYQYINLEITETAAAVSGETLLYNMEQLTSRGVNFSMDDYGTGFSNMINLIQYPFQIIKLDKSLVWSAMENEKAMCALKHTIGMVKEMGMKLIAEGVETLEQAEKLEELGCDFFQGYYYSKPVNGAGFLHLL